MKQTIGLAEAKAKFSEVVERVRAGQTIVVLRNGEPAAEIRPVAPVPAAVTAERIKALRARIAARTGKPPKAAKKGRLRELAHRGHQR